FSRVGIVRGWLGAMWMVDRGVFSPEGPGNFVVRLLAIAPICLLAFAMLGITVLVIRSPASPPAPMFLFTRSHAADSAARRCLATAALHALVVALVVGRALEFRSDIAELSRVSFVFGAFYVLGIVFSLLQRYPQRSIGLVPYAVLLITLGFICTWIAPSAEWPAALFGVGVGLAHVAPRAWLVLLVPPNQRGGGGALGVFAPTIRRRAGRRR